MNKGIRILMIAFGLLVLAAPSTGNMGIERVGCHENSLENERQEQQVIPSYI